LDEGLPKGNPYAPAPKEGIASGLAGVDKYKSNPPSDKLKNRINAKRFWHMGCEPAKSVSKG